MWVWLSALAVLRVTSQLSLSKRQAGAWDSWSEWGPCSRSCGSGVEVRSRSCRSLRPGAVPDCLGPARMHRTCNVEDCPAGSRGFREVQCSEYDEHDFQGRYYKWTPFYGAPNSCELNCQPKGENFYFTQAAIVVDGTQCEPDKPDVCIEGVCRKLGCDGQLESGTFTDTCGVCGGGGTSCFPVHGAFTDLHLPNGYNHVLVIPIGATNIQVSEMMPSKNFLAIKSLRGEYYFNGGSTVDYDRVLPGAGTMLRYERGSDDGGVLTPESVTSTGPTTEPLVIEILTHEMNRGIKYEYYLPHDRKITKSGVTWSFTSWSECSAECDEGFQTRHVYCTEGNDVRPNVYCINQPKPTTNRTCNIEPCPAILRLGFRYKPELRYKNSGTQNDYRWREGPWDACSVTCGEGHQTRPIYCLAHSTGPDGPSSAQAPDQECQTRGLRRPEDHRSCQAGPCTEWIVGEWQPCSAECGPGEQIRNVTCRTRYGCDDRTMPDRIQRCNLGPCRSTEWVLGPWSQCSAECGPGEQIREVTCGTRYGCDDRTMPDIIQRCNLGPCRSPEWVLGPWSQCSAECGPGDQIREVTCGSRYGCDNRTMPDRIQPCNLGPCRSQEWVLGPWSQCSAECGPGEQTREVTCGTRYGCDDRTMPDRIQLCNLGPCRSPEWVLGPWSQCSAECGPGEQTREVTCGTRYGCDDRIMPDRIQLCNLGPCRSRKWDLGPWSQCSAECGPGEQTREVTCGTRYGCDDRTMPDRIQLCNLGPCRSPEWVLGPWSQCSAECGPGEQTREVACGTRYGCDDRTMPDRIQLCNLGPCRSPEWVLGPWSQCSAECGPGEQTREVTCGTRYGCDDRTMPDRIQLCNLGPCRSREWDLGPWSQCSAECGPGEQTREVTCATRYGCDDRTMPDRIQLCNLGPCRSPEWVLGPWSQCSAECGPGEQIREVTCGTRYGCDDRTMPDRIQLCNLGPCRSREWVLGPWSQCSADCGPGEQTREVTCGTRYGCDDRTMPDRIQLCNLGPCRSREWDLGPWSQCSAECGPGEQIREVTCGTRYGCDDRTMPDRIQRCNLGPCRSPEWVLGPWSQCSTSCGRGRQTRDMKCGAQYGCDSSTIPPSTRVCNLGPCRMAEWSIGPWSECSVTCGKGTQMRSITCQVEGTGLDRALMIVSNTECNSERMPRRIEECQGRRPCTNQMRWHTGSWGLCSLSCGGGMRKRQAICYDEDFVLQDSQLCRFQERPRELEACNTQRCTFAQEVPSRANPGEEATSHTATLYEGHGLCRLPSDPGSCKDFAMRWFFVPENSECNRFWYGGCEGNDNRFKTKEACVTTCRSQSPPFDAEANQQRHASIDAQPSPGAKPWPEVEHDRSEHSLWIERGDPTVVEGQVDQTVELRCRARGSHGLEQEWLKDGKPLQNIRYMQFPNGSLHILMATQDDAGIFTCKVSSGDLQEFRQVSLHFPAEPLAGDTLVEVPAGTTAHLPCLLPRRTTPSHWQRLDDGPMNARSKVLRDGALLVPTVALQDDGRYSCVAESQDGNIYSPALRLKVTGGLTITKPPGDLEISAGKRAEFPCTVSDKNANIIWTRNGVTLESGAKQGRLLVSSDGTLVVQVVQDTDEGHYTCNAYAGSAAVSASAHLKVAPSVQAPTHNMTSPGGPSRFLAWGEHAGCVDRLDLANCKLIVQAKLCDNRYFTLFCCHSCARPQS
uniref:papilin-like isoform X4 n=1 Tax=Myxine glutinosa TaxID=7769 RepID=UPI00358EEF04